MPPGCAQVDRNSSTCLRQLASVVVGILAITAYVHLGPKPADRGATPAPPSAELPPLPPDAPGPGSSGRIAEPAESPAAASAVAAPAPPAELDRAKVAAAESVLDSASRDRARADGRAAETARALSRAANQAALDALRARKLAFQVRDPSTRIAQAAARGGFIRGEREKLATEVATLRNMPRPKSKSILGKSPVARPAADEEFHFELRRNRISFIDLNQLLEKTKADAQLRIRMADRFGAVASKVGPVGAFSLAYELIPAMPNNVEEMMERRNIRRFDLKGWELVPEYENRGETFEATQNPISEYTRALNRINQERATITLWVYPDSFGLYRRIRNDLVDRGFSVAARPSARGPGHPRQPHGDAIRGAVDGSRRLRWMQPDQYRSDSRGVHLPASVDNCRSVLGSNPWSFLTPASVTLVRKRLRMTSLLRFSRWSRPASVTLVASRASVASWVRFRGSTGRRRSPPCAPARVPGGRPFSCRLARPASVTRVPTSSRV